MIAARRGTRGADPASGQKKARYENRAFTMVPKAGLEPARLAPLPPQDSVSTNSTTSAMRFTVYSDAGTSDLGAAGFFSTAGTSAAGTVSLAGISCCCTFSSTLVGSTC